MLKEILLEIGLIKEIKTIWGSKKVPQPFSTIAIIQGKTVELILSSAKMCALSLERFCFLLT